MTKKTRTHPPRPRTTLPLRGTTSTPKLQLDHRSDLALEWARAWLKTGPGALGVDPLLSGVVRRALAVYVDHLQRPELNPEQEARAVRSVCSVSKPDEEDRQADWKRLEDHRPGQAFPTFSSVLHGPHTATEWAAFNSRVDDLVDQITNERRAR